MKNKKVKFKILEFDWQAAENLRLKLVALKGVKKIKLDRNGQGKAVYDSDQISYQEIFQAIRKETGCEVMSYLPLLNSFPSSLGIVSLILNVVFLVLLVRFVYAINPQVLGTSITSPSPKASAVAVQSFEINKDDHVSGNFDAKVTLVEFSDFECPFCVKLEPTLKQLLNDYNGKIRLVYKQNPLAMHKNAEKAAEASECASEQGKFWEYHDKLFGLNGQGLSIDVLKKIAADLGLDANQFNSCLDSGKFTDKIAKDMAEAKTKGVTGAPATFVNGKLVSGAQPIEAFKKEIDSQLKK